MTSARISAPSARPRLMASLLALAFGVLTLTGCATTAGSTPDAGTPDKGKQAQAHKPAPENSTAQAEDESETATDEPPRVAPYLPANLPKLALTSPILFELLEAELALQRQQPAIAYSNYQTLAAQTGDARLARRATEIALVANDFPDALVSGKLWHKLDPDSAEARQTVETLLISNGRLAEAEPALAQRLATARQNKTLPAAYLQVQRMLLNARNHRDAWAAIQRLSEPDLKEPEARLARAQLAAAAGERQAAADEAQEAYRLNPDDTNALVAAVEFLQPLTGGPQRANVLLDDYLKRHPDNVPVRVALGGRQAASKQIDAAIATLREVPDNDLQTPAAWFTLAQLHFQKQELEQAVNYLKRYVALPESIPRDNGPAYLFLGEIEESRQHDADAIRWLEQTPAQSPFRVEAVARRAVIVARQQGPDAGQAVLKSASPQSPRERQLLVVTESQIMRDAGRHQEAFAVIDRALKRQDDTTDLLYDHAIAAEKIGRLDIVEKSLRELIKRRPENAHAYNALGYTLADHNRRLPEALKLIRKADQLMPDNAHVLDSLGWVYYRMGRIPDALAALKRAYALQPDVEVATHYGEVLWVSGSREEARQLWREAEQRSPGNTLLRDTLRRLGVNL